MKDLPLSLTVSALAGAFTLLRPADWSPRIRRAFVLAPGVLTAAGLAAVLLPGGGRRSSSGDSGGAGSASAPVSLAPLRARPAAVRAGAAVVAGTAVSALHAGSLRVDAAAENWLAGRGLAAPRLWMAAGMALASLGLDFLHDRNRERPSA